ASLPSIYSAISSSAKRLCSRSKSATSSSLKKILRHLDFFVAVFPAHLIFFFRKESGVETPQAAISPRCPLLCYSCCGFIHFIPEIRFSTHGLYHHTFSRTPAGTPACHFARSPLLLRYRPHRASPRPPRAAPR